MRIPRLYVCAAILIVLAACVSTRLVSPLYISPLAKSTRTPMPSPIPPIVVPGNLLANPSFEGQYHSQDGMQEINIAGDWRAWFIDEPPCNPRNYPACDIPCPLNCLNERGRCGSDWGCFWARPEFAPIDFSQADYRIHSGARAQKYFTYGRMHEAGLFQRVVITDIASDDLLMFSVYIQGWQCFEYSNCDFGRLSDKPYALNLQVGIDPSGGNDPGSNTIVWSVPGESFDKWSRFIMAVAPQGNVATVFIKSRARFDYARKNNDVYVDDAALVILRGMMNRAYLPIVVR